MYKVYSALPQICTHPLGQNIKQVPQGKLVSIVLQAQFFFKIAFWQPKIIIWSPGMKCWSPILSFQTLKFLSYLSKHSNSYPIFPNIRILILSFQTLRFSYYLSKHWNSYPIFPNIGGPILSFQTLEFLSCLS